MRTFTTCCCRRFQVLAAAAFVLLASDSQSSAAIIADFPFTGSSFASTDAGTTWTTSNLTTGVGLPLTTSAGGVSSGTIGNPVPAAEVQYGDVENQTSSDVTLAESIALDDYYSFTVTPFSGGILQLNDISFDLARTGGAPVSASVFTSIDGFTAGDVISTYTSTLTSTMQHATIDLSFLPNTSSPLELRIYLSRAQASVMTNSIMLDNIMLTANVTLPPAPEPSCLLLLGTGMLFVVRRRRRMIQG